MVCSGGGLKNGIRKKKSKFISLRMISWILFDCRNRARTRFRTMLEGGIGAECAPRCRAVLFAVHTWNGSKAELQVIRGAGASREREGGLSWSEVEERGCTAGSSRCCRGSTQRSRQTCFE